MYQAGAVSPRQDSHWFSDQLEWSRQSCHSNRVFFEIAFCRLILDQEERWTNTITTSIYQVPIIQPLLRMGLSITFF